jgi:3D (Asp-Asp-Asp) domain-containing protein
MKKILFLLVIGAMAGILLIFAIKIQRAAANPAFSDLSLPKAEKLLIIQGNSLSAASDPSIPEPKVEKKVTMVITAYSSTLWETDDTPLITASGSTVKDGIVANNLLPFGTQIRIPDIYGDKVFVVEDRMNLRKSNYHLDVWFPEYEQALIFGAKRAYVEILAN